MTGTGNGAVLVTGASTGIGEATAHHLAGLGFDVHAGVRKQDDGDRLVAADPTGRLRPVILDVADQSTIDAAREQLGPGGLVGLVNNAGIAVVGPVEVLPLAEWRRQLEVNVIGQVAVTQAFLPALRASRGRIVFTGSLSGRIGLPGMAPYAASKHALEALADSLRREVRRFGIQVSLLEPGSISTPIWGKGIDEVPRMRELFGPLGDELYGELISTIADEASHQDEIGIEPIVVARAIEHALTARRPRHRYVIGKDAQAVVRVVRHLPSGLVDRVVARQFG